jgi:hypothetical protein
MANQNPGNPLTEQHFTDINNALSNLKSGKDLIAMAKQAGIDTGEAENKAADLESKLLKVKNVFFPGR